MTIAKCDIHCITIDTEVSEFYFQRARRSFEEHDYKVCRFPGVTPCTMFKYPELVFAEVKQSAGSFLQPFTDTEKAVWASHYKAWHKCLNDDNPMIVIEHDALCTGPLYTNDRPYACYGVHKANIWTGVGYYIEPVAAERMINHACTFDIDLNVDGFMEEQAMMPYYEMNAREYLEHYRGQLNITHDVVSYLDTSVEHNQSA